MTRYLALLLDAARVQIEEMKAYPVFLAVAVAYPAFIGLTSMFMLRHAPDFQPTYVVVGTALTALWTVIVNFGTGSLYRDLELDTIDHLLAAPAPLPLIVAGRVLGDVLLAIPSAAISYAVGAWLLGYPITIHDPLASLVSFPLAVISLWSLGMLFAAMAILWLGLSALLQALSYPVFILSGFLFPAALLPGWLEPVGYILPAHWAARALHGAAEGGLPPGDLELSWLLLTMTAAGTVLLAWRLCQFYEMRVRRTGTVFWE